MPFSPEYPHSSAHEASSQAVPKPDGFDTLLDKPLTEVDWKALVPDPTELTNEQREMISMAVFSQPDVEEEKVLQAVTMLINEQQAKDDANQNEQKYHEYEQRFTESKPFETVTVGTQIRVRDTDVETLAIHGVPLKFIGKEHGHKEPVIIVEVVGPVSIDGVFSYEDKEGVFLPFGHRHVRGE